MHKQMYHKTAIVEFIGKVASRTGTVEGKGTQKENCAFWCRHEKLSIQKALRYSMNWDKLFTHI